MIQKLYFKKLYSFLVFFMIVFSAALAMTPSEIIKNSKGLSKKREKMLIDFQRQNPEIPIRVGPTKSSDGTKQITITKGPYRVPNINPDKIEFAQDHVTVDLDQEPEFH